jgi:hypothetical protein
MKGKVILGGIAGVAAMFVVSSAMAEPFDSKLQASVFTTKLVQAADECSSPTTVIGGLAACAPSNVATASGEQFSVGKLIVKSKAGPTQVLGILKSSGNGGDEAANDNKKVLAAKNLRVRLTLRVTKRASASAPADAVTWSDVTITCGSTQPPVSTNGNWVWKGSLVGIAGCNLDPDLANEGYQKEIVTAEVIDNDSGLTVAVPGVRKKPPGPPTFN